MKQLTQVIIDNNLCLQKDPYQVGQLRNRCIKLELKALDGVRWWGLRIS